MPLLSLVLLWLTGRVAVTCSSHVGWLTAMLVDGGFLFAVVAAAAREISAGRNWRNLPVVGIVVCLLVGNIAFHIEVRVASYADVSIRIGVSVVVLLISLIGGRIIPSFTRNWLVRENPGRLPAPFGNFDKVTLIATFAALVLWIALPSNDLTSMSFVLVGLLHCIRLARWAGDRTVRDGLVVILHIGYAFVPIGFLLEGAAAADVIDPSAGLHAWMAGGVGVMTLAVMSRATLGHTGQALRASKATLIVYAMIVAAALARVGAVLLPQYTAQLLHAAAFAWVAAFAGFATVYAPLLLGHRKRRKSAADLQ
jgi:uncharacterized protein involved in response to NO